ncbi:MAG: flagellar hook capping FlgD N-terminal domain-containing protein [Ruminobacter sp.]|nr:flagellar hook capping FlgD N-terminal domain-containing protein [Ruminobacter sp.]
MSIYDDIGLSSVNSSQASAEAAKKSNGYLGQEEFLSLLTTELSYQDPTSPVDNSQMVSQMAQLSMVSSLSEIGTSVSGLSSSLTSSQAYMASSFVGTEVRLNTSSGYFNGVDASQFAVIAGNGASNMTLTITDENGAVVNTVALGDGNGDINLYWDGTNSEGKIVGAGKYTYSVNGLINGMNQAIPVYAYGKVSSVTLGDSLTDATLNLQGGDTVNMKEVGNIG